MEKENFLERIKFNAYTKGGPGDVKTDGPNKENDGEVAIGDSGLVNYLERNGDEEYFEAAFDISEHSIYDTIDFSIKGKLPPEYCKKNGISYVDFSADDKESLNAYNLIRGFMVIKTYSLRSQGKTKRPPIKSNSLVKYLYSSREEYLEGKKPLMIYYNGVNRYRV